MAPDLSCADACNNMSFTTVVDNPLAAGAACWDSRQKSIISPELNEQWSTLNLNLGANQDGPGLTTTMDDLDEFFASFKSIGTKSPGLTDVPEESCEYLVASQNEQMRLPSDT